MTNVHNMLKRYVKKFGDETGKGEEIFLAFHFSSAKVRAIVFDGPWVIIAPFEVTSTTVTYYLMSSAITNL